MNTSNYKKFKTNNFVVRKLFDNFYNNLIKILKGNNFKTVLDAGCGEGETIMRLKKYLTDNIVGFDINKECVAYCKNNFLNYSFSVEDIYKLPYKDNQFDLVFCLEVLEHLTDPLNAISELNRVSNDNIIISVPYEPWFMLGNLLRGKNISRFGNDSEHIQHFNLVKIRKLLEQKTNVVKIQVAFPWIIIHCKKKN